MYPRNTMPFHTWGDPAKFEMITVNGKRLDIAQNLYKALLRLRDPIEKRRLWIDAICINQEDIQERYHQVRMMQPVYSAASSVIVWLGEPEQVTTSAIDLIIDCGFSNHNICYNGDETAFLGLSALFRKPWWRRIWIVQEAVAARQLAVYIGHTVFLWAFLHYLCREIEQQEFKRHELSSLLRSCGCRKFTALDSLRRSASMPLVHLLQSTHEYQATDPRDKLYALLGMTSDVSAEDLSPDYTKPVREVFEDLVAFMAVQRQSLDIICSGHYSSQDKGLPSWLPCWQAPSGLRRRGIGRGFNAIRRNTRAVVDMSQFPRKLIAEGIVIDSIKQYGRSVTIGQGGISTIHRWQDIAAQGDGDAKREFLELIVAKDDKNYLEFEFFMDGDGQVDSAETQEISDTITRAVMGRRLFVTEKGRMGLGPSGIQVKDRVAMLSGCQMPLVLRPVKDHWIVIGEATVSRLIDRKAKKQPQYRIKRFHLK